MSVADIERIAKAIWETTPPPTSDSNINSLRPTPFEELGRGQRALALAMARRALTAIREPTEAMFEAAREADYPTDGDNLMTRATDKIVYQAMIDEMLRWKPLPPMSPVTNANGEA